MKGTHYDFSEIIAMVGEDEDFIKDIVKTFHQQSSTDVENLINHINNQQFLDASKVAHKLKSTVRSLGNIHLSELAYKMETKGKENPDLDEFQHILDQFLVEYENLVNELKENINHE